MCRINPRVDFAFKKLFGSEENKDLLIDFINSVISEKDKVYDLEIKNPYNAKSFRDDKLSILDIKAQDSNGKWFNIEMQIIDQDYFDRRALYYWSRLYTSQLISGINYDNLKKTISINILNFDCLPEKNYHNTYKIMNLESHKELIDHLEIHFIELVKYDDKITTMLDRWVNFLKSADVYTQYKLPLELEEIPTIKKAIELLDNMSLSPEERESYESRLKWLRDEEMGLKKAENKGYIQGKEEGIEVGKEIGIEVGALQAKLEIARNLLDILDDDQISIKIGLEKIIISELRSKSNS